ncbi:inorganic pyrophosphatase [Stachybotrys elegans]|uniref:inorganic diphosphatase n=1 Tax=Stachybotrys elegans TaxID=80388 RepID=A0A8K0SFG0_9HYPO|nr:inorganic pyrophosphatase [Stachybotrys elegans]
MVSACALFLASVPAFASLVRGDDGFDYSSLSLREVGARNTMDWRMWFEKDGQPISPWHDIPLYPFAGNESIINYYIEIPRWSDGKIETKRNEPLNPIFHDDTDGQPRFVASVWPHKSYPFHYGSIPQTWEDSTFELPFTGYPGDNDPMDVFDVTSIGEGYVGEVRQAKVLGGLAMIDDESTDWKVIVVDIRDPLAAVVDTVADLEMYRPSLAQSFYDWFIYYKVIRGKGLNHIVGNDFQNATFMSHHIAESHGYWRNLVRGETKVNKIRINQTSNPTWCKSYIPSQEAAAAFDIPAESNVLPPAERPAKYDRFYYLDTDFATIDVPGEVIDIE